MHLDLFSLNSMEKITSLLPTSLCTFPYKNTPPQKTYGKIVHIREQSLMKDTFKQRLLGVPLDKSRSVVRYLFSHNIFHPLCSIHIIHKTNAKHDITFQGLLS